MVEDKKEEIDKIFTNPTARKNYFKRGLFELVGSSSPETRRLIAGTAIIYSNIWDTIIMIAEMSDRHLASQQKTTRVLLRYDIDIAKYLGALDRRLMKLEKKRIDGRSEVKKLRASLAKQQRVFDKHKDTLKLLEVWSQKKLAKWVNKNFDQGGLSGRDR